MSAIARSRRQADALAAVVRAAYAFQATDQKVDAMLADDDGAPEQLDALMQERADTLRELFAALEAYAPYYFGVEEQP